MSSGSSSKPYIPPPTPAVATYTPIDSAIMAKQLDFRRRLYAMMGRSSTILFSERLGSMSKGILGRSNTQTGSQTPSSQPTPQEPAETRTRRRRILQSVQNLNTSLG